MFLGLNGFMRLYPRFYPLHLRLVVRGESVSRVEELLTSDRVRPGKDEQSPQGKLYLLTDEADGKIIRVKNGTR